jgi:hypothetical protein
MASRAHLSFLLLLVVVASLAGSSSGVFHIVGAGKGWRIAPNKTYYEDWARTRDIHVGDKLSKLFFLPVSVFDSPTLVCISSRRGRGYTCSLRFCLLRVLGLIKLKLGKV